MPADQPPLMLTRYTESTFRRAIYVAIAVGGLGLIIAALLGHALGGVLGCVGLGLGAVNGFLMHRSLGRLSNKEAPADKKQVAFSSLGRLAALTAVAVVVAVLVRPEGIAVFFGLALFQLVMTANAAVPVLKEFRKS